MNINEKAQWDKDNRKAWESEMFKYEREQARKERKELRNKYRNTKILTFNMLINR